MNQQEILEYNKRCAEFLGWTYVSSVDVKEGKYHKSIQAGWYTKIPMILAPKLTSPLYKGRSHTSLKFHSDWNCIMEVKDMIQRKFYFVDILGCGICTIKGIEGKTKNPHISAASDEPKEAVVEAINQFLIWYSNENSDTNR